MIVASVSEAEQRRNSANAGSAYGTQCYGANAVNTVLEPGDIEGRVRRVVKEVLSLDNEPNNLDLSIRSDLAPNSLDQLSLFMALEDEFGGRIEEHDAEQITTLRDVVEHVRARMSAAPRG